MDDLISRHAAIDICTSAIDLWNGQLGEGALVAVRDKIAELPSAEPKIIHCKDCKHFVREDYDEYTSYGFYNTYFSAFCDKHWDKEQGEYIDVKMDDYCSFAERRTDDR